MIPVGRVFQNCGQETILIDRAFLNELRRNSTYQDAEITPALLDGAERMVTFAESHDNFSCGIVKTGFAGRKIWLPNCFLDCRSEWVRVSVLNAVCRCCNWRGIAADPTIPGLYDGLADRSLLLKEAAKRETVPCPHCGQKLDHHGMHAIWVYNVE